MAAVPSTDQASYEAGIAFILASNRSSRHAQVCLARYLSSAGCFCVRLPETAHSVASTELQHLPCDLCSAKFPQNLAQAGRYLDSCNWLADVRLSFRGVPFISDI